MNECLEPFKALFQTKTHPAFYRVLCYIKGLFKSEKNRANCTSIADSLGELDHQSLNHVLCNSPWDYNRVLNQIAQKASGLLSDRGETALLIDEVGFRKKEKYSACVGRQYLGCLGKQDNGQVAVVGGLCAGVHYCPIAVELYMPEDWEDDCRRRKKVGIPEYVKHRSKPDMALDMILGLRYRGIWFDYVGFDALYGSSIKMIAALDKAGVQFIGDVRDNVRIFLREPKLEVPPADQQRRGRRPKRLKSDISTISLKAYMDALQYEDYAEIAIREGTKQSIKACFHTREVWVRQDGDTSQVLTLRLLIRKDSDGTIKYSFSNMHAEAIEKIVQRQGQRVFVERIFEEGKNQLGMGDYQIRSWEGFHKHMTLCFLAFFYIAVQKLEHEQTMPLTAPLIRKLVASTITSIWENPQKTQEYCLKQIKNYRRQIKRNLQRIRDT